MKRLALAVAVPLAIAMLPVQSSMAASKHCGHASWYGSKFHGKRTASGARFNKNKLTAAHRSFKFGSRVKVTNQKNGKSVTVTINDRGPFHRNRIIDLSEQAALHIGIKKAGSGKVCIQKM